MDRNEFIARNGEGTYALAPFKTTTYGECTEDQRRFIDSQFQIPLPAGTQVGYNGIYLSLGVMSLATLKRIDAARRIIEACEGEECMMCSGEACWFCGAGCWSHIRNCTHDVMERHQQPGDEEEEPVSRGLSLVEQFDRIVARFARMGVRIKR